MKIWVDGQAFQSPSRFRGIGRYILELLKAIKKNHQNVEMMMSFNASMPNKVFIAKNIVKDLISEDNIFLWEGVKTDGEGVEGYTDRIKLSEQLLAYHVACLKPDLALSASPFEGGNNFCVPLTSSFGHNYPVAGIFYDAIPYRYPELYLGNDIAYNYYMRRLFCHKNFDLNLSISDFSHNEIVSILNENNSVPIYAGISEHFLNLKVASENDRKIVDELGVSGEYLLYVGELDWRKNYLLIADALQHCTNNTTCSVQLVIAGGKYQPGIDKMKERWITNGLQPNNLIFLGHVSDEELVALNKSATALIQPSLMEGFGLTALEGIACETPVLVADAGALPEVVDCKEALFHPQRPQELSNLIDRLLVEEPFREHLLSQSRLSLNRYTWDKSSTLAVNAMAAAVRKFRDSSQEAINPKSIVVRELQSLKINKSEMAQGLVLAEPHQQKCRVGTFVDVSSTALIDHRTGIQRVVYSISKNLVGGRKAEEFSLLSCNSSEGFRKVQLKKDGNFKINRSNEAIDLNDSERVLMLDGSWDYLEEHLPRLRDFHLRGGEVIYVLYDLVPFRAPAYCLDGVPDVYNKWFIAALEIADGFICISKAVSDNLEKVLVGMEFSRPIKISYWTLGADLIDLNSKVNSKLISNYEGQSKNDFLMVGTIEPRKGYDFALKAFSELWDNGHEVRLTIIGKQGWSSETTVQKIRNHPQFGDRLFWLDNATDRDIADHYKKSDALISASHIEGFGLPVVESAYFKTPAIVPDIPVFRDVANTNSTLFYNPSTPSSLVSAIVNFNDQKKSLLASFEENKYEVLSWEESAEQLVGKVLCDDWYCNYKPKSNLKNSDKIATLNCVGKINPDQVSFEFLQVSDLEPSGDDRFYKCTIKTISRSKLVLSSKGPAMNEHLGVFLGTRIIQEDGTLVDYPGNRSSIPLVMVPDLAYYISVKIDKEELQAGRSFQVQFIQENHMWYEDKIILET